ncbi:hypothetical protein EHW99_2362 [Erwinia amylovora]|uniref:Uncharacterized protein n=2 Tax=Erwinia amylovora TaxID=552 RepID=A0A831EJE3_ERWAM|nr:hypothetical protein EaACW_1229 [Erwinia amylovora ACW56400]QJQ55064.1 hypothetical protein EHX00_2362 [Erwinia amylovora]CBA20169.1 hypothetical protein predicted by Glimmer/Critica [Erwinia amylovora CFBP1430]CCO78074.1 hypothetical protein BN432_1264 [Erwinia amylovora Ea356]CCO81861.1 hypothetical protein BN433_1277 [Erwinia amylovora Ea266]CCO85660.1 hypothetical protein BN434_1260 [Erwinia amylovora CFBP 2585]CCO89446.1 hypothetical protein BN435_1262 [Erwinia amylovora 01SFR-BO]CCO
MPWPAFYARQFTVKSVVIFLSSGLRLAQLLLLLTVGPAKNDSVT